MNSILTVNNNHYNGKVRKEKTFLLSGDSSPYVTKIFCALCIIVYILDILTGYTLTTLGLKDNAMVIDYDAIYRLFTCTILHSSVIHLLSNMIFINAYGQHCEYYFGHKKMLMLIVATGFTGSLCSLAFTEQRSVGASGIAFGLLGALISVKYAMPYEEQRKMVKNCIYMVVVNILLGVLLGGVDNAAHIGGFIGGLAIGYGLSARKETGRATAKMIGTIMYFIINVFFVVEAYVGIFPDINAMDIIRLLIGK